MEMSFSFIRRQDWSFELPAKACKSSVGFFVDKNNYCTQTLSFNEVVVLQVEHGLDYADSESSCNEQSTMHGRLEIAPLLGVVVEGV